MDKNDIKLGDLYRIFIGNAPPEFLIEVFLRTVITYLALVVIVRLLGKRLSGRVTLTEMALTITLGAIIGSPIQIPERGIVVGIAILFLALIFQWLMNNLSFQKGSFESITQGTVSTLVDNGVLDLPQLRKERISQNQLFAALRDKKVLQLGELRRVYLEPSGQFSIVKRKDPQPGLSVLPVDDELIDVVAVAEGQFACGKCGAVTNNQNPCPTCGSREWHPAVNVKSK